MTTAPLILYSSPTSPFVRKVLVVIREAGIKDVEQRPGSGTPLQPDNAPIALNPLGKIPTLVTPEGLALYDSRVICRWLDDHAGAGLYPRGAAHWPVLTLEALSDGILEAALLMVYESRLRPEALHFEAWVEGQWEKIARSLDALEAEPSTALQGGLNMGQIALGCALGYLDFRHSARNWRKGRPQLAAWEAGFATREAMLETRPKA